MENDQKKKKLIMRIGIISIMVIIFIFWLLNIKNVFNSGGTPEMTENGKQLQGIKEELNATVDKLGDSLNKIKATDDRLKAASSSLVNELVKDADNNIASSTVASSTSSSSASSSSSSSSTSSPIIPSMPKLPPQPEKTKSTCPSYINCMPTIGEARPCQIPVGCEGITQIAY